ncbi:hypothetical protein P175DRAFT_0539085 [Aspergillus ochraceoroseus IBT 24754]|uniref:Fe2OG dioxygenase domain-containing protein n=2 Tax=Aspergillus subgen. Nidulantes TaxID=2720870 RepID=A0A0F8XAR0_9EURO|nr:uncharacterized protein P175DRAFT_0539085 [Aspergillus ochraceoroseus IBT 24754]KKK20687.1 hypothetical protein ARAM_000332 [Aspergillus rambellii]PTU24942.1 hypothetical protein P175DRAFT_0539085 [Aspergillus ochraceoroseus IBT 24754]
MATVETLTVTPISDTMAHLDAAGSLEQLPNSSTASEKVSFEPSKHLAYTPPSKVHTMEELGYPGSRGVSPIGVSEPFPLFSTEAIQQMRKEVLSDKVFAKYQYSSELAQCQLRGYAEEYAPFVYDAWKNPETLAIISKIAGVDLVPAMDLEIGHINISMHTEEEKNKALKAVMEKANREADEGVSGCPWEDDHPIVDWHTDSYPFVCVTMLSDCKGMIGGETALRKGNGEVVKVRGPQMGSAVILQGRYIEHQALRALGTTERISMVTSFRPRASLIKDDTVLTTVRPISDLGELYLQFAEYRFDMLQDRFRDANKLMRDQQRARRPFDTLRLKQFIREQIEFLEHMEREIVEDEKVIKGVIDDSHLISEDLKLQRSKKRRVVVVA